MAEDEVLDLGVVPDEVLLRAAGPDADPSPFWTPTVTRTRPGAGRVLDGLF